LIVLDLHQLCYKTFAHLAFEGMNISYISLIVSILPGFGSFGSDLVFVCSSYDFFVFNTMNLIKVIRARSTCRCFVRVEHNDFVKFWFSCRYLPRVYWLFFWGSGMKRPRPTLIIHIRETCSTLNMQLVLHKQLAVSLTMKPSLQRLP
jgi:hypothetical protein